MDKGTFIKRKEKGYTQFQLSEKANIDERTVRRIENNELFGGVKSLNKIFDVLDISMYLRERILSCDFEDFINDEPAYNYEEISEKRKKNKLLKNNPTFNSENISYMKSLFQQVGVTCDVSPYNSFKTASVVNRYELNSIQLDLNLRVLNVNKITILHIINFYITVNQALINEALIKDAFIKALEIYARKLKFNEIHFTIDQDFEKMTDQYSNLHSELPTEFIYSLGTEHTLYRKNNYYRVSHPKVERFQVEWQKKLN